MLAFNGAEILDVAGPASVFAKANIHTPGTYDFQLLAPPACEIITCCGLSVSPQGDWTSFTAENIDTLIIAGGLPETMLRLLESSDLVAWLAAVAPRARRVVSVCTGAFALGQAGLLQNRCATTHWSALDLLQSHFPETKVKSEKIYVRDGNIWTSAGVLTGIDLALALVEEDLGRACALEIGNILVLAGMRPGSSPQKSALLASQAQVSNPIRELLSWIQLNLTESLHAPLLAGRMGMSDRHFRRVFQDEAGMSPAKYVATQRLDYAAVLLRSTTWNIEAVARKSGFDSTATMQRGFTKRWKMTPTDYRAQATPPSSANTALPTSTTPPV